VVAPAGARAFHSSRATAFKVAVVGAGGGIGQPLSLLLKTHPLIKKLSLYDISPVVHGVGADLSHCDTNAKIEAHQDSLAEALKDADVVVVPAGVPRKPGQTRDDLFNMNAKIVAGCAKEFAKACPNAAVLIISNPVNSTVPIFAEVLKRHKVFNPKKVFGVTTLDVVRANTFVAENQNTDATKTNVTVVGGHSGVTILPLLSQVPGAKFSQADKEALTKRIQFGGDEVVAAKGKAGGGSATLSMAYAGSRFTDRVLRALNGEKGLVECTFVQSSVIPGLSYFSSPVELGKEGVEKIHGFGSIDAFETEKLEAMKKELTANIKKGEEFVEQNGAQFE